SNLQYCRGNNPSRHCHYMVLLNDCDQAWWRKSKKLSENLLNLGVIRDHYVELLKQHREGSAVGRAQFAKWFNRVEKFASYYALGGQGYKRDHDLANLDFSHLQRNWNEVPTRSIHQLSEYTHKLNWVVYRGKSWQQDDQ